MTYRYMITSVDEEIKTKSSDTDNKIEAYIALGELRNSKDDMINFLKVYGKKVSTASKPEFLQGQIKDIFDLL
jgi:hypothetical protein